jgi:DNA-binding transcriptional regulator YdaS (Cro superfamily)
MTAEQFSHTRTSSIDWSIAKAIRLAVMDSGKQQREIALASGMHPSSFSKSMQGERPWRAEEVVLIARATGVSPAVLLPNLDSNQEPSD